MMDLSMKNERVDIDITIKDDENEKRTDPTTLLPEEPMSYEIKKKKKKKKKKVEDPFKGIEEKVKLPTPAVYEPTTEPTDVFNPEVSIKVENIEVELDFNDFANDNGLMLEGPQSEDSQDPTVKIEPDDSVMLTIQKIINDEGVLGYGPNGPQAAPIHVCKVCHLVFQSTKTLKMHQKRKHKSFRKSFKHICDYCGMAYEQKNSLVAHIKRKHGPNSTPDDREEKTCDICALVFKGQNRLRMHMRRKHGCFEESFQHVCQDCGLTYDKYRSLVVHIQRKHSNVQKPDLLQWFNCPFCPKVFTKRETYARHVQRKHRVSDEENMETEEAEFENCKNKQTGEITCKECPLVFSSLNFLKLHMRRKHNALKDNFRLKCKICNLSYEKIESLKRHIRRKHDKGSHCEVCNKQFDTREQYLNHSHEKLINECHLCGLIFASQGGLGKHLRCTHKIDSPKTVFCDLCNEGFYDKRQLKPHYMRVHLNATYTCQFCNKIFKAKESFRRHVLFKHPTSVDDKSQMHKCDKCSEEFTDEFELCKHIHLSHRDPEDEFSSLWTVKKEEDDTSNSFQCTKCPETYNTWELLRNHYEHNHQIISETQCQICGEMIASNELQKHIKNLHTDTNVQCKYCEYITDNRASMTQHLLRHQDATTNRCDYPGCRYKSFYEDAMAKHKRKHADQGVKLQCSECSFQTMNKYILKYHEEAHATGKKRYSCDQCDYATILPANLVQHKYKHSTEKRFRCEVCPFATKYNTSLRFHVKKKHCDLPSLS